VDESVGSSVRSDRLVEVADRASQSSATLPRPAPSRRRSPARRSPTGRSEAARPRRSIRARRARSGSVEDRPCGERVDDVGSQARPRRRPRRREGAPSTSRRRWSRYRRRWNSVTIDSAVADERVVGVVPLGPLGVHPDPAARHEVGQLRQRRHEELLEQADEHDLAVGVDQHLAVAADRVDAPHPPRAASSSKRIVDFGSRTISSYGAMRYGTSA
jgi:hypothetical protein